MSTPFKTLTDKMTPAQKKRVAFEKCKLKFRDALRRLARG